MALAEILTLPDGRALCFDDVGDPDGRAVLSIHGTPDSRRARHPDDGIATAAGVRLVAVDRPGVGGSSIHLGGTVGSFADDTAALARHLGITRWSVLGWSAGAVPALACAARHPRLVAAVGITAGLPPFAAYSAPEVLEDASDSRRAVAELGAELGASGAAEMLAPFLVPIPCTPELAREHLLEDSDGVHRAEVASVPGALEVMAASLVDSVAHGLAGLARELELQIRAPDFDLADVTCPVWLWYGTEDHSAPPAFGHWLAARLPDARLTIIEGAGHALVLPRWEATLRTLGAAV